ncbi:transcription elongation factor GreA [Atopobium sp. oral taxon 199]|uniref:transcription elongation factor GreA n=1 Tax=Atopobium sp. oral taxon 199 TaxID=712156 RepID=UPI00034E1F3A|nr:transcription elongation factor GreA [Atopobium sp. oral taxon 199]EPD77359.1 transcription elongation factor GreA [Atopobium sp. oral taxon 199 str. F0494]
MDTSKEIVLTPEGRQKLVEELAYREGEKHDEIVERIKEARGFGDLSENSEYDAAKEEQSHNESRINEIRQILSVAKVVEGGSKRRITVAIGTTVELEDAKGKTAKYIIVGTTETNSLEHKISNESPAGEALIGHKKGDKVEFTTPNGKVKKYTITAITR